MQDTPGHFKSLPVPEEETDIRGLFLLFWRRRAVILTTILLGLICALMALYFIPPHYKARALLVFNNSAGPESPENFTAVSPPAKPDMAFILSEIEIIRSRTLAAKAVENLKTASDRAVRLPTQLNEINTAAGGDFKALSVENDYTMPMPETERQVSAFLDNLNVRNIPGSYAVQIEYVSRDPRRAALAANVVADLYIRQNSEQKFENARRVQSWMEDRLGTLSANVERAEAQMRSHRVKRDLPADIDGALAEETFIEGRKRLALMKAELAENRADVIHSAVVPVDTDALRRLKERDIALASEVAELAKRYGDKHPKMIEKRAELSAHRALLSAEADKSKEAEKSEAVLNEARADALQDSLNKISNDAHENSAAITRLRQLEEKAAAAREAYNRFLASYEAVSSQIGFYQPGASVVSYASVPLVASYPNKGLVLSLSAMASLFLGLFLAAAAERIDGTFKSAGQLERLTGLPCHALIPRIKEKDAEELAAYVLDNPASAAAEAVRTLRAGLRMQALKESGDAKVVMVTSSFPDEGKSTLSLWLGLLAAKAGERAVLVDVDLRRARIKNLTGQQDAEDIQSYLAGENSMQGVITENNETGLDIVYAAPEAGRALEKPDLEKMSAMLDFLKKKYDLVILDSPACLPVADARLLGMLADQVLYAAAWSRTAREYVMRGASYFLEQGKPVGFALSQVDMKRYIYYGYGDFSYYEYKPA